MRLIMAQPNLPIVQWNELERLAPWDAMRDEFAASPGTRSHPARLGNSTTFFIDLDSGTT
jgi:hypothetical protein